MTRRKVKPSSTDVARLAGVSQSAVSRAFAPGGSVSRDARQRIMEAAETLGYRGASVIRPGQGEANLIGVVMGEITNPFYPEVLEILLEELEFKGYRVLLKRLTGADTADEAVEEVLRCRVRGAIITSSIISADMAERCGRSEVPVVLFNRHVKDMDVSSICCDNVDAGRLVANLFLDNVHRRLAFVSGTPAATTNQDRQKGFVDRLSERGVWDIPILGGENTHRTGYEAAQSLIAGRDLPDGIFCASDILACGVIDALRGNGVRIPEDVSVIGFDDVPMAAWPIFNLTTIRQRRHRMVKEAVATLIDRIGGRQAAGVRLIPGELVLRGSARIAPREEAA